MELLIAIGLIASTAFVIGLFVGYKHGWNDRWWH